MARSRRKTKRTKITGNRTSDKKDRSEANRKFRRTSKIKIKILQEPPISLKEVSDPWNFRSDGLAYWNEADNRRK